MEKIPTIWDRDWDGNRGVVPVLLHHPGDTLATEKLDGTNVRLTVRNHLLVRVEARMNPTKSLKQGFDIEDPWYRDAWVYGQADTAPADKHIMRAAISTDLSDVPDGEWSAEAVGPSIQGNPLDLDEPRCFFFDRHLLPDDICVPVLDDVPESPFAFSNVGDYFRKLEAYLRHAPSRVNPDRGIEGIVWHDLGGSRQNPRKHIVGKVKAKDYKASTPVPA